MMCRSLSNLPNRAVKSVAIEVPIDTPAFPQAHRADLASHDCGSVALPPQPPNTVLGQSSASVVMGGSHRG